MQEHLFTEHGRDPEWFAVVTRHMTSSLDEAFRLCVSEGWRRRLFTLRLLDELNNRRTPGRTLGFEVFVSKNVIRSR